MDWLETLLEENFLTINTLKWRDDTKRLALLVEDFEDLKPYVMISDEQIEFRKPAPPGAFSEWETLILSCQIGWKRINMKCSLSESQKYVFWITSEALRITNIHFSSHQQIFLGTLNQRHSKKRKGYFHELRELMVESVIHHLIFSRSMKEGNSSTSEEIITKKSSVWRIFLKANLSLFTPHICPSGSNHFREVERAKRARVDSMHHHQPWAQDRANERDSHSFRHRDKYDMDHNKRETDSETSERTSTRLIRSRTEHHSYKNHSRKKFGDKSLSNGEATLYYILSEFVAHEHTRSDIGKYSGTDDRAETCAMIYPSHSLHFIRPETHIPTVTAGLIWQPDTWPIVYAIATTARPNAIAIWRLPAVIPASTADPQPRSTSTSYPWLPQHIFSYVA